jgi:hypothetical protein
MDPFEFSQLRLVLCDFGTALDFWDKRLLDAETLERWTPLYQQLKSRRWASAPQDEIVSVAMSETLHKILMIVSANHGAGHLTRSCPAWLWLIMEIDTQLAKRTAHTPANTMAAMRAMLHAP